MRYLALACDYDGTLATNGRVGESTLAALEKVRASGRKLIMVTGRELEDLQRTFPELYYFEIVVAENGALLYYPGTKQEKVIGSPPEPAFLHALREQHVGPMSVGRVIVATWKPHETRVLETIRDMGLDLQVIFNKDAVMVLPAGINKATGLTAALGELGLSPHEVVGIGDAENDLAFLGMCECGVAVDNALPAVKERADLVMRRDHGPGVEELIGHLLENDLRDAGAIARHRLLLGARQDGQEETLDPYGVAVLIAGPSGSGKSTAATSLLETLHEQKYQFVIIDPEGDYDAFEGAVTLGSSKRGPTVDEVLQHLHKPTENAVVNLIGLSLADRPPFFLTLLPRLLEMRARTGRPHWIVVNEAHHLLPAAWVPGPKALPQVLDRSVFITVHPEQISAEVLKGVTTIVAVGKEPEKTIGEYCRAVNEEFPARVTTTDSQVVLWQRSSKRPPVAVALAPSKLEHRRHVRKYAEGELPPERSFYFRGPEKKLNLRAQNLVLFNQIAEGVDDATWLHHLSQGDYSRWFREGIGDETLAALAERIEKTPASPQQSRADLRAAIERLYTLPTSAPLPMPGTSAAPRRG